MEEGVPYDVPLRQGDVDKRERIAKMKIRDGVRLILLGIEELWVLPRSFETKRGKVKR